MRKEGLEPSPQRDMILSHARLPIPPLPQGLCYPRIIVFHQRRYKGRTLLQLDAGNVRHIDAADLTEHALNDQLRKPEKRLHLRDAIQVEPR